MMRTTLSLALFAASASAVAIKRAPIWAQCGGIGFSGPTTCDAGLVCVSNGPYYSQCLQGDAVPPVVTSTTTTRPVVLTSSTIVAVPTSTIVVVPTVVAPPPPTTKAAPVWGQCGGIGFNGPSTCEAGSVCTSNGPYYSQCTPGAAAPPVVTSRPVTSTVVVVTPSSKPAVSSVVAVPTSTKPTVPSSTKVVTPTSTTPTAPSSTVIPTTSKVVIVTPSAVAPPSSQPTYTNNVCSGSLTKFKYFGVNQASAEFTPHALPGGRGKDYEWPTTVSIDSFLNKKFNTMRVPFLMERLSPNGMTGALDQTYLSALKGIINHITGKGGFAILDPHNYMRFREQVISETDLAAWWKIVATEFKSNGNVIFDVMNEPYGIDAQVVFKLNQAAVNAIRSTGATSQLILVEGTAWTGAHSWVSSGNAAAFANIKDPNNNIAIEMHQYLDSDSSGTQDYCPSANIGAEKIAVATKWLKDNNQKGFMGEFGAGRSSTCVAAISNFLCAMAQSGGAWIGGTQWAAGPWWGGYFMTLEDASAPQVSAMLPFV